MFPKLCNLTAELRIYKVFFVWLFSEWIDIMCWFDILVKSGILCREFLFPFVSSNNSISKERALLNKFFLSNLFLFFSFIYLFIALDTVKCVEESTFDGCGGSESCLAENSQPLFCSRRRQARSKTSLLPILFFMFIVGWPGIIVLFIKTGWCARSSYHWFYAIE